MSVTVEYKGLREGPTLITGEGRFPAGQEADPQGPDLNRVAGLYAASSFTGLRRTFLEQEQARVLEQVRLRVDSLSSAIAGLHVPQSDVVGRAKTAVESDQSAFTASADEQAAAPAQYGFRVDWTAQGGEIISDPQNPVEVAGLTPGEYSLELTIDDDTYTVTLDAHPNSTPDTQEEFMARLARAIDQVDPSVKAELVYSFQDAYDGAPFTRPMDRVVQLKITSTEAGQGPAFYLADVDGGSLVSDYGLNAGRPRRSASLELNGAPRTQSGNRISLDGGHVSAQVHDTTDGKAGIEVKQGAGVIQDELANVLQQYNGLVSYLDQNADLLRPSLRDRVVRPLEDRFAELRGIGLRPSAGGKLLAADSFLPGENGDFSEIREALFEDDNGWLPALELKLEQIQGMDIMSFAMDLAPRTELTARQQAWDLVESIGRGIVNHYI